MLFIASWSAAAVVILALAPFPLSLIVLGLAALFNALLWVLLVGGLAALREVIAAHTQPPLPARPPTAAGRRMLVVGAGRGLGLEAAALAAKRGWCVESADVSLSGPNFLDLTSPKSIADFGHALVARGVRRLDALLLVAGVCDAAPVRVAGASTRPRILWANYLGHALVVQELEARGIAVGRIVLVSSGSYARGGRKGGFFPAHWDALGAMPAYAQSKFLVTAWASWLRGKHREVAIINPGPMRSAIGDAHVPTLLWPTYGLMKEVLFPPPSVAAEAVLHVTEAAGAPADYVDIRVSARLNAEVSSAETHAWLLEHTRAALEEAGVKCGWAKLT